MSTNPLEQACIRRGIAMPALRAAMRQFRVDLVALGPGATTGIHDFGVFYVQRSRERYVMREGELFKVDQRDVVKLRPEKSVVTKFDESDDVKLVWQFTGASTGAYIFQSTSRANRFTTIAPSPQVGATFHLVRSAWKNAPGLVMAKSTVSDADLHATASQRWISAPLELLALRLDFGLLSVNDGVDIGTSRDTNNLLSSVKLDDGTIGAVNPNTASGREALAWFRQRTIDVSER